MRNSYAGSRLRRAAMTAVAALLAACAALLPLIAHAAKEGVYGNGDVFFTLENVRYSEGADDAIVRFAVALHNGGATAVDYNGYGVRVVDAAGIGHSARLTGKSVARVAAGREQSFPYEARVGKGTGTDSLRVVVFAWDRAAATGMNDIGTFSVSAAMEAAAAEGTVPEASVSLGQIDATINSDARVAFRVGTEYLVRENGEWTVYVDLTATNAGDAAVTLPAGLAIRLQDAEGRTVAAEAVDGADKTLLPGAAQRMTVKAAVPDGGATGQWSLLFANGTGTDAVVLDSLPIGGGRKAATIGEARPLKDGQGRETVSVRASSAVITETEAGLWVRADVTVSNDKPQVAALPGLSAVLQARGDDVSVPANDTGTHPAYLSQGESETYSFRALLPKGVAPDELELALFGTRGGSVSSAAAADSQRSSPAYPVLIVDLRGAETMRQDEGADYRLGDAIGLALDGKLEASVTELELYDNETYGFKTAVAKVKLTNADTVSLPLPDLGLALADDSGRVYSGTVQSGAVETLASGSSYMRTYSFMMPEADESGRYELRFYDGSDASVSPPPLGSVRLAFGDDDSSDDVWNVYPYRIELRDSDLMLNGTLGTTFAYALTFNVRLERKEPVVSDATVSKLRFDLVDPFGLVIASQSLPFQGATKLLDGGNSVTFSNLKVDQFSSTNRVLVYETVETPNGTVSRKLGALE
ncbi:hypothetical protein [Paenibacillus flagellatus]|uniref:Uncharacterized protein n=1 Tax=Paenibacillus flagellatus TaxID=2211139 RepID=A0A2V5KKZ1_9BACL|nr:hypothetical protein [Paenibacillus flagellatus]PYI51377.1 hypothetical protein DLM86_25465 [Paenibacillus flagellatus]